MPFVVTDSCIQCKYTDCVSVCPMDCFVEGPNFLAIDPDGCIDCSMCVPECPVGAIYNATDLPAALSHFEDLNARYPDDWNKNLFATFACRARDKETTGKLLIELGPKAQLGAYSNGITTEGCRRFASTPA